MNIQRNVILTASFITARMAVIAANVLHVAGLKEKEAKELQFFSLAKISLSESIKAAEQKIGVKAVKADLGDESNESFENEKESTLNAGELLPGIF